MPDFDLIKKAALDLRAVNNKLRHKIINLLIKVPDMTVTQLYVKLRIEQSVASQHLAILRRSEIVVRRSDGKEKKYSINHDRLRMIEESCDQIVNHHSK